MIYRCPLRPRRHCSVVLRKEEVKICFAVAFLVWSSHETIVNAHRWFWGVGISYYPHTVNLVCVNG